MVLNGENCTHCFIRLLVFLIRTRYRAQFDKFHRERIIIFCTICFSFLEILEYLEDLKYYYINGYGNPNSDRMGCPMVKDLIDNFKYYLLPTENRIIHTTICWVFFFFLETWPGTKPDRWGYFTSDILQTSWAWWLSWASARTKRRCRAPISSRWGLENGGHHISTRSPQTS